MFDIKWIRANAEAFDAAVSRRKGVSVRASDLLEIDEQRRSAIQSLNEMQELRNKASKEIGQAMAAGDKELAEQIKRRISVSKAATQVHERTEKELEDKLFDALSAIPNLVFDDVPDGTDESGNVEYFGRNGSR